MGKRWVFENCTWWLAGMLLIELFGFYVSLEPQDPKNEQGGEYEDATIEVRMD